MRDSVDTSAKIHSGTSCRPLKRYRIASHTHTLLAEDSDERGTSREHS